MRWLPISLVILLGLLLLAVLGYSLFQENHAAPVRNANPPGPTATIKLGVIPERDIFAQHRRFRALADEIGKRMEMRVELVTVSAYQDILEDFTSRRIDGAFLGSLIAVLAVDRCNGQLLVKTELPNGSSSYRGVIFVREDSPIQQLQDMNNRPVAMVRTTLGGHLFPVSEFLRLNCQVKPVFVGTHDEAVFEVIEGRVDAGAAKDRRLEALLKDHPSLKLRTLAQSSPVPDNALVLRGDVDPSIAAKLRSVMLSLQDDAPGRSALMGFEAKGFSDVRIEEYNQVFDLVERIADAWGKLGFSGPPPRRPGGGVP